MAALHQPPHNKAEAAWHDNSYLESRLASLLEAPDWYADAACKEHPEIRWVDLGRNAAKVEAAREICAGCLVRLECLHMALADPALIGVWGGTTAAERQSLRREFKVREKSERSSSLSGTKPPTLKT